MSIHAHVHSRAMDCDGLITRIYVMPFLPKADKSVEDFKAAVYSQFRFETVENNAYGFLAYEDTEEGYRSVSVEFCEHACNENESTYRDHRAELMGY